MNGFPYLQVTTGDRRIATITPGVVGLLHGRPPPVQQVGYGLWFVYAVLLLLIAIQVTGIAHSTVLLRRWRAQPARLPAGPRAILWRIGLPLVLNLSWGLAILSGMPAAAGASLWTLVAFYPDVITTLSISAVVALGWAFLRTALAINLRRLVTQR
jgi:hypothetical protein